MTYDIFENRIQRNNQTGVPVWFMRQAGRYHDHYQNLKKQHTFMELCRKPELACEVTMGPIEDFDFDAAILFSDLLFPLEHLGLGLEYSPGPKLSIHPQTLEDIQKLYPIEDAQKFYSFQGEACKLLKEALPREKSLLGFVGAPFTLFTYATCGSHAGALEKAKTGLYDRRFDAFFELLYPQLLEEVRVQANNGIDAICFFDTAVGELCLKDYKKFMIPKLNKIFDQVKSEYPHLKIVYYSRNTHLDYFLELKESKLDVLGVDWRVNLKECFSKLPSHWYIQGNIDPVWLHLSWKDLHANLIEFYESHRQHIDHKRWIAGLGHGVLQHTPVENVRNTVKHIHENWLY